MGVMNMVQGALSVARELPVIRQARRAAFDRRFATASGNVNYWRGVYGTFEEALAHAPRTKPHGYDNDGSAALYGTRFEPLLKDYPALFWLQRALDDGARSIFDLGGHVGMKYYAFEPLLQRPTGTNWTVCDVPAVVRRGREMAVQRGVATGLSFTDRWQDMDGLDLLYASGSLQYLPETLGQMLAALNQSPQWLVINTTPMHPREEFFTVNGTGTAFCAYRIAHEERFTRDLLDLGYERLDRWKTPKHFRIPFHPQQDLDHYVGMCLRRRAR